ncbi:MAG: alpha/beta fold hydrolase [Methanomethylophilus sp.]|nr:alpha/beta fold hydrolase [Methanomethylophilus sp.]MDD4668892.1 alpha/beta fold hydrolase [Methanomethylophilus sp.]
MEESFRETLLRSRLGVFLLTPTAAKNVFNGRANDYVCRLTIDPGTWQFTAVLTMESPVRGQAETAFTGCSYSFDGVIRAAADWLNTLATDDMLNDTEPDVRFLATEHGPVAYWAYNEDLKKTPVLFIHGGPGGESNPVRMRTLMLDRPVYCYDQANCGHSAPVADLAHWTVEDYVEELREVVVGLHLDRVVMCGASWGAGLIGAYLKKYGAAGIVALVLPSPFLNSQVWTDDQEVNFAKMPAAFQKGIAACRQAGDTGPRYHALMREYYKRFLFADPVNWPIADAAEDTYGDVFNVLWGPDENVCTGVLTGFDVEGVLPELKMPALFMCGDSDEVTLSTMQRYRDLLPGARLAVIPGAGHATAKDRPELYAAVLTEFLGRL